MEDHEPGRGRYGTVGAVSCLFEIGDTVLRAGGRLPETTPEQAAAWARLRQEHARSMSR